MKQLYHYTKDDYFKSIIKDFKFRAVLSTQSNDDKDTVLLKELFVSSFGGEIFKEIAKQEGHNESQMNILKTILTGLFEQYCDDRDINFNMNERAKKSFVICFTEKKDSRFLWESYAKNEGLNLMFEDREIESYFRNNHIKRRSYEYCTFRPLIYKKEEQYKEIRKILRRNYDLYMKKDDDSLSNISTLLNTGYNWTDEKGKILHSSEGRTFLLTIKQKFVDFALNTISELLNIAPFIKHEFWEEEKEYRLAFYRTINNEFLDSVEKDEKDRYFIEVPFGKELLKEIKIGPKSKYDIKTIDEQKYLAGYSKCKLDVSKGIGVLRY